MAKERLKNGSIAKKHDAWYWRRYVDGKRKWEKIAEISDKFRSKGDVTPLINAREIPEQREGEDSAIADFVQKEYLPWAKANKRPATYNGYSKLWTSRVKDHVGEMRLSEYKPFHASRFLGKLAPSMTTASLQHIRALLSGIFAHAVGDGRVDGNPIRDAKCRVNPKPSQKAEHYTAVEMRGILTVLKGPERAIMALAFIGLRPAEIIGLRWEDVTTDAINIQRSMWRGQLSVEIQAIGTHCPNRPGSRSDSGRASTVSLPQRIRIREFNRPTAEHFWTREARARINSPHSRETRL